MKQYKTRYPGLRVRRQPTTAAPIIGMLREGAVIDADHDVTIGENIWHALPLAAGGALLLASDDMGAQGIGYAAHIHSGTQFTDAVGVTLPPVATGKTRLGVNVITGSGDVARRALAAGCNALSIIDNFQLAADLANDTSITVMARRFTGNNLPPPDPDVLYEGAQSPHVVYLGLNECDATCYGSVGEIAARAAWDRDMWRKMKARGRKYAGGGFSVGTPDYTKPEICEAMRTHYAPLYADGMAINYHLYSPWPNHAMDVWYELRWQFLFERCGFDPSPDLAGIYCDETGMDQGSVGGFPAVGFTSAQVGVWCRRFLDASQGGGYGNTLRAAAIFQAGNTTDWNGYNCEYAFAEIGAEAKR